MPLEKVISTGQTGVERAALDSAIERLLYSWGGWSPKGRLAEDGEIPESYFKTERISCGLHECERGRPFMAKHRNIRDSDATLILRPSKIGSTLPEGIKLTIKTCRKLNRPYRIFDPYKVGKVPVAVRWVCETNLEEESGEHQGIKILNIVGPTESKYPGIYDRSLIYISDVLGYTQIFNAWGVKIWAPRKRKPKTI